MSEQAVETKNTPNYKDVARLPLVPGTKLEIMRTIFTEIGRESKALIITGYASGSTRSDLNPLIQELDEQGVPVFIISNNQGDTHGIRSIRYEPQEEAVNAGAIPLRDINRTNVDEVTSFVQEMINQGKIGEELKQAVIEKFGSPIKE